jgi:hypothetical protein
MWILFVIELALVATFAIALFGYLYWRQQQIQIRMLQLTAEERAQLLDRIQSPEVVVQARLDKIDLCDPEYQDMGPWTNPTIEEDDAK